jgi:hypothetical protein
MSNLESALATTETTEAKKLSRLQGIREAINAARQASCNLFFDYNTNEGNRAARSHIAELRKINGDIERARKEAKAIHLARGSAVDDVAKQLKEEVAGLIAPHEDKVREVEAAERARVDRLRRLLTELQNLAYNVTTSEQAEANLARAKAVDPQAFEEFESEAADLASRVQEVLAETFASLKKQEEERAELERLREKEAEREQRDREEALRREGEQRLAQQLMQQQTAANAPQASLPERPTQKGSITGRARSVAERLTPLSAEPAMQPQEPQDLRALPGGQVVEQQRLRSAFVRDFCMLIDRRGLTPEQLGVAIANRRFMGGAVAVDWDVYASRCCGTSSLPNPLPTTQQP